MLAICTLWMRFISQREEDWGMARKASKLKRLGHLWLRWPKRMKHFATEEVHPQQQNLSDRA